MQSSIEARSDATVQFADDQDGKLEVGIEPNDVSLAEHHDDHDDREDHEDHEEAEDPFAEDDARHYQKFLERTPWVLVITLFLTVFGDSLAGTAIQPILPGMLHDQMGVEDEAAIGLYVGIIVGIYSFARFCSSFYLGHVADMSGRKRMIQLSMLSTTVATVLFGFCTSVWEAILLRLVEGLLSSNQTVAKASLSDISTSRNRAILFAYMGATFAFGRSFSSALGGLLGSVEDVPIWLGGNRYVMTCIVCGLILFIIFIFTLVALPETQPLRNRAETQRLEVEYRNRFTRWYNGRRRYKVDVSSVVPSRTTSMDSMSGHDHEEAALVGTNGLDEDDESQLVSDDHSGLSTPTAASASAIATSTTTAAAVSRGGSLGRRLFMILVFLAGMCGAIIHGFKLIWSDSVLVRVFLIQCIISLANGAVLLAAVLFAALSVKNGGLGFTPLEIGVLFCLIGFSGFLFQILCFKWLVRKFRLRETFRIGCLMLVFGSLFFPLSHWLFAYFGEDGYFIAWTCFSLIFLLLSFGLMLALPVNNTILTNAAPVTGQGLTQGTAQSFASLWRSFGPFLTGVGFSLTVAWQGTYLVFVVIALLYAISYYLSRSSVVPEYVENSKANRPPPAKKAATTSSP